MNSDRASRLRSWMPHLLLFVMPVAAVLIGYGLWFLLIAILRAPDWLARLFVVHFLADHWAHLRTNIRSGAVPGCRPVADGNGRLGRNSCGRRSRCLMRSWPTKS